MHCNASSTTAYAVPFRFASVVILLAAGTCFSEAVQVSGRTHHHPKIHRVSVSEDVLPSPEIDDRVELEVAKAKEILDNLDSANILDSPYLVSAIYYHDGFLTDFPTDLRTADPERRIVGRISRMLSPESKARFVCLLHNAWIDAAPEGPAVFALPVNYIYLGGPQAHNDAIDMFAPEGTSVHSASRGVVIMADRDWSFYDVFSAASRKGGNAVIIFDPDNDCFYRYCHLSTISVCSGDIVESGQIIGEVGHTGLNASQPGHGNHLHFEVNEYLYGHVRALEYRELRGMVDSWSMPSP